MRRTIGVITAALMLAFVGSASAVVFGEPDGNEHPNVGALLAPQAYSDGTWASCTGTLISPTVFLTGAHCDWGLSRMAVTFDSVYAAATGTTYWGTWYADPRYRGAQSDPYDLAVVVLDNPVAGITPALLPPASALANLPRSQEFTSVGYGAQSVTIDHGPTFHYADIRYAATSDTLFAVNKAWLRISMHPALGDGGTCYGDSGGPNFLGAGRTETNIVAATTITGDSMCRATNVVYRHATRAEHVVGKPGGVPRRTEQRILANDGAARRKRRAAPRRIGEADQRADVARAISPLCDDAHGMSVQKPAGEPPFAIIAAPPTIISSGGTPMSANNTHQFVKAARTTTAATATVAVAKQTPIRRRNECMVVTSDRLVARGSC